MKWCFLSILDEKGGNFICFHMKMVVFEGFGCFKVYFSSKKCEKNEGKSTFLMVEIGVFKKKKKRR
jgi:hypothetical protein